MPSFVQGAELSWRLYDECVGPVLRARFPDLPHSAALLGRGSELLGFDDETSTDHDWQPRALVFLTEEDELRRVVRAATSRGPAETSAPSP